MLQHVITNRYIWLMTDQGIAAYPKLVISLDLLNFSLQHQSTSAAIMKLF